MHNKFEANLVKTFEMTKSFQSFKKQILHFIIERNDPLDNSLKTIDIQIGLSYADNIPVFTILDYRYSLLLNSGHTYGDGVMCHNIPPYRANEINGKWYANSIINYLNSLILINTNSAIFGLKTSKLRSTIKENDLIEYERIASGSFFVILDKTLNDVTIGKKYAAISLATPRNVSAQTFQPVINQFINSTQWEVVAIDGENITLNRGPSQCVARFQPQFIVEKDNENERKDFAIIGLGSLGSYFAANFVKDYQNGRLILVDGDFYLYSNTERHYLGNTHSTLFVNKAWTMKEILERERMKNKTNNSIEAITFPLGMRTHSKITADNDVKIKSVDTIVELTGTNEVLKYIMDFKDSKNKTIYKASLYDSGNVMLVSKIDMSKDFEEVINEWDTKRASAGFGAHSAYTSESPANNTRVSMMGSVLNELIKNNTIKNGEYFIYDWRDNIRKM